MPRVLRAKTRVVTTRSRETGASRTPREFNRIIGHSTLKSGRGGERVGTPRTLHELLITLPEIRAEIYVH